MASDCDRFLMGRVEHLLVAQDTPSDPRQLVGQCRCQLVAVQPRGCVLQPWSEAEAKPIVWTHQDDFGRLNEQGPEVLAPAFGDAAQNSSATCAVLTYASGDGPWLCHLERMADRAYAA
jgi:hypothetical protein